MTIEILKKKQKKQKKTKKQPRTASVLTGQISPRQPIQVFFSMSWSKVKVNIQNCWYMYQQTGLVTRNRCMTY